MKRGIMHLTLRIYGNKSIQHNVVRDEDIESHIEYNKTFRFGCVFYVDGERVYDGVTKKEYLGEYDEIAKAFFADNTVNMCSDTRPYR